MPLDRLVRRSHPRAAAGLWALAPATGMRSTDSDPAVAASAEDGEESPPPNGYHVRNANELLRTLEIETEAPVAWYPSGGGPADVVTVAYGQWRTDRETRAWDMGVWLTISGGIIVEVEEQWTP